MKFKPLKLAPAIIGTVVIALVCLARVLNFGWIQRLEHMTYDKRVRLAASHEQPVSTNLGCVFITDESLRAIAGGQLGKPYGLYWPRHIYSRVLRELSTQGARAVAFDVLFENLRMDHGAYPEPANRWPDLGNFLQAVHPGEKPTVFGEGGAESLLVQSDDHFAWQLKKSGMAILAAERGVRPHALFATNAIAIGDISADRDADGVLRRAQAFRVYTNWHTLFRKIEEDPGYGVDLSMARFEPGKITLPRSNDSQPIKIDVDADGRFDLADFLGDKIPSGWPAKDRAFSLERVWHMGIVLAARELQLNLADAEVNLPAGQIVFHSTNGVERVLPLDEDGYFYINWEMPLTDRRFFSDDILSLLIQDQARSTGLGESLTNLWRDRLVVIGSAATGNDLTDRGATPLEKDTFLVSKHWNVANSIITGRFIRTTPLVWELLLIAVLGTLTAFLTWQLRAVTAALSVLALVTVYSVAVIHIFTQQRLWLPVILPVGGAFLMQYVCLQTYRVVFEQRERRRVLGVFDKMVSPNVAREVLKMESLTLGGSRREITVYFADVRGFTELTDATSQRASQFVAEQKLSGADADAVYATYAREMLDTVNTYLSLVADIVKQHDGTLDKYIGDCVMSYWGAPTASPCHALQCVHAAIDAQRAIHELNLKRFEENKRREQENVGRAKAGQPLVPMLPILYLGSGINSGMAVAGLMGSEKHERSYTVFGREVNLASRLESVSGRGRIIIGEATYEALLRDDPALAKTCIEQEPTKPKGFNKPIRNFEVPWQKSGSAVAE